eukprot:gene11630-34339_t
MIPLNTQRPFASTKSTAALRSRPSLTATAPKSSSSSSTRRGRMSSVPRATQTLTEFCAESASPRMGQLFSALQKASKLIAAKATSKLIDRCQGGEHTVYEGSHEKAASKLIAAKAGSNLIAAKAASNLITAKVSKAGSNLIAAKAASKLLIAAKTASNLIAAKPGSTLITRAAMAAFKLFAAKAASNLLIAAKIAGAESMTSCNAITDIARAGIDDLLSGSAADSMSSTSKALGRDAPKKLDVVANDVMKEFLSSSGVVGVIASEEDDQPIVVACDEQTDEKRYVVVFDPLDGSRNIEVSIPTGTIFGVYEQIGGGDATSDVLQPGSQQVAAGYTLYSSACMMVISFGNGTHGFTLDPSIGEFVLTHPNMRVPERGQIYSLNDARYHDWPRGLQDYIDNIRQGKGENPKQYSSRYVCSLVADFHRTLIYGGWAANPRSHLRLVYEANPLAMLAEQPTQLHQRLPLFLGSALDIAELESYGDVQQDDGSNPMYDADASTYTGQCDWQREGEGGGGGAVKFLVTGVEGVTRTPSTPKLDANDETIMPKVDACKKELIKLALACTPVRDTAVKYGIRPRTVRTLNDFEMISK